MMVILCAYREGVRLGDVPFGRGRSVPPPARPSGVDGAEGPPLPASSEDLRHRFDLHPLADAGRLPRARASQAQRVRRRPVRRGAAGEGRLRRRSRHSQLAMLAGPAT
jgi:hypothetical protein